jgi:heme oxygenase
MVLNETEVVPSNRVKPRFYSLDDEILLQSLLTTLANLDFAYEQERERVSSSTKDANLRARVLQKLRDQHRERRHPYMQHLTVLHEQIMPQAITRALTGHARSISLKARSSAGIRPPAFRSCRRPPPSTWLYSAP